MVVPKSDNMVFMANDCWIGDVGLKRFGLATVLEESGRSNSRPWRGRCIIDFVVLRHLPQWRMRVGGGGGQAKVLVLNSLLGTETI